MRSATVTLDEDDALCSLMAYSAATIFAAVAACSSW